MFERKIKFDNDLGVNLEILSIENTRLLMHEGILEIALVLEGNIYAKVSCEDFDLKAGDYIVINQGDPHYFTGEANNTIVIYHFDLGVFRDVNKYIEKIIFACESFDLARYKNQENLLREILLQILDVYLHDNRNEEDEILSLSKELLNRLTSEYTMDNYYNRQVDVTEEKTEKYYRILNYIWNNYDNKNILDLISEKEFYSKSYISHLFKEVSSSSFSDTLTYYRIASAEKMLLLTEETISDIALNCGFSDVKYFNKSFKSWFSISPSEYRKTLVPMIHQDDNIKAVNKADAQRIMVRSIKNFATDEPPRLSLTPLLLKNVGSKNDIIKNLKNIKMNERLLNNQIYTNHDYPYLIPIKLDEDGDLSDNYILNSIETFIDANLIPCFIFSYSIKKATCDFIEKVILLIPSGYREKVKYCLEFSTHGDKDYIDDIYLRINKKYNVKILPLFVP